MIRRTRDSARRVRLAVAIGVLLVLVGLVCLVLVVVLVLPNKGAPRLGQALDQLHQSPNRRVDVGHRTGTAREGPVDDPRRTGERAGHQHVVHARQLDAVGAVVASLGPRATGNDLVGDVGAREQLDGHVLHEVRELGVTHAVLENRAGVAHARMIDDGG